MPMNEIVIRELREERFRRQGQAWFRIPTGSMRPLIEPGEKVLVAALAPAAARRGDILLYRSGADYVTHRLVGVCARQGRTLLLVKGDALAVPEELSPEAVRGRIVVVEKRGGRRLRLDSLRGRIVDGYLKWKNCRRHGGDAGVSRDFPLPGLARRLLRPPAASLQAAFFKLFL